MALASDRADSARQAAAAEAARQEALARIILTTETTPDLRIEKRLDIITAEAVIGMHIFRDIAAAWRDTFGGRSQTVQSGLRDARKMALQELRIEAVNIGADAVVGVDLDYSEISGGGKSMLFLVASGTAVTLAKTDEALA
ncbi:YbjQ family protein [Paenirhodobacter populi]|nr:YbjQ family protein [Sinirhodobacter populi]